MKAHVVTLTEGRVQKLMGDNERLVREIPFLAQRLDDLKEVLRANLEEINALRAFLSANSEGVISSGSSSDRTTLSETLPIKVSKGIGRREC